MNMDITRARQRLHLSFSQTRMLHGQTRYNVKSRFFDELPPDALKWLTPQGGGFGSGFERDYASAWQRGSGLKGIVGAGREGWEPPRPRWGGSPATPAPAPVVPKSGHDSGLRTGQGVFHNKFGEGVVLALEGSGNDARAHIRFGRHGDKWLALSVAKLTPI